jgi:hypothetical protein
MVVGLCSIKNKAFLRRRVRVFLNGHFVVVSGVMIPARLSSTRRAFLVIGIQRPHRRA